MNAATRTTRRPFRAAITSAGLVPTKRCAVLAGHGYFFGGSSSPSFVIVLAVTDDSVTYCDAHKLESRREQRWIFEDLAARAGETVRAQAARAAEQAKGADLATAMGRVLARNATFAAEQAADHGATVTFADYDRVRAQVTRDGDAYYADQYGLLVDFNAEQNLATVETGRAALATMTAAGFRVLNTETIRACPVC
jgi:hypothetical protein